MKALKNLWRRISGLWSRSEAEAKSLVDQLVAAKQEHISDLRVLLDKAEARERELAQMVRLVMEERFYRPTVTRAPSTTPPVSSPIAPEHLSDVAQFDHEQDAAQIAAHDEQTKHVAEEFESILKEHNEYRSSRGMPAAEVQLP